MAIVNYVVEHIRFMEYASEEKLKGSVMLLWYALMHQMNQRAQGNVWPEEFVRIDNDRLLSYLPMEYDTFAAARNKLKQLGRIDYIPGERNKTNPAYKMIYFYPNYVRNRVEEDGNGANLSPIVMPMDGQPADKWENGYPEKSDNIGGKNGCCPKKTDNIGYKLGGKPGGNMGGKPGGKQGDIYNKHIQETEKKPKTPYPEEDDEETARSSSTHAGAREAEPEEDDPIPNRQGRMKAFRDAYIRNFGKQPTNREIERILTFCHISKFPDETAMKAMEVAAGQGPGNPIEYTLSVLIDWTQAHVYQAYQVDEYLVERDRAKNRGMYYGSGDAEADWKAREEAVERRKQENIDAGLEIGKAYYA